MDILTTICAQKAVEIAAKKKLIPQAYLEQAPMFGRACHSLKANLLSAPNGIIAEFKRRSPSKDVINQKAKVDAVANAYEQAGAAGMSVLTDGPFFGGSLDDLLQARAATSLPILRKDFMIDPYQLYEAKAYGADVILLIAACLSVSECNNLASEAKKLGLEVLLEVHNLEELQQYATPDVDIIGVNNRNLKTFEVSLENSKNLAQHIPDRFVKISESGISSITAINELSQYGFKGYLLGENFMKTNAPGIAAAEFIKKLKS
ncbi:MAG: indole-3-glycerol phosphate synthase TrpC [Gilvibacter sp.]